MLDFIPILFTTVLSKLGYNLHASSLGANKNYPQNLKKNKKEKTGFHNEIKQSAVC